LQIFLQRWIELSPFVMGFFVVGSRGGGTRREGRETPWTNNDRRQPFACSGELAATRFSHQEHGPSSTGASPHPTAAAELSSARSRPMESAIDVERLLRAI
jgi:hypothetical protein